MTQEPDRRPSSPHRRSTRAGRNRPVLVTSTENEENAEVVEEAAPTLEKSLSEVEAQNPPVAPSRRRLPNFFSTVGKKTEAPQEVDTAQARLARAIRGKVSSTRPSSASESDEKAEVKREKEPARPSTPSRPPSAFKTRYLIGMAIYLLGANFIGSLETSFFRANHIDDLNHPLAQFNLFGGLVKIYPSTLAFLATLIILLVALARLDLIPRSFTALSGQTSSSSNRRGGSSNNNQNRSENVRSAPPTMRQGVKGADDDLYQEYRTNQRRRKKYATEIKPAAGPAGCWFYFCWRNSRENRLCGRVKRRCPIFPWGCPHSIIGAEELNFRVRDGNGWTLFAIITGSPAHTGGCLNTLYITTIIRSCQY